MRTVAGRTAQKETRAGVGQQHETWKSPATRGGVISVIMAAFNRAEKLFAIPNPLKGLKKPKAAPRLASFTPEEEEILPTNLETLFQNLLFATVHTSLRPFCALGNLVPEQGDEKCRGGPDVSRDGGADLEREPSNRRLSG
ncbi:hypothetical protein GC163_10225 [bacterium]|nr:hypothetical protein [bacterium]